MNNYSLMDFAISGLVWSLFPPFLQKRKAASQTRFLACSAGQAINNFTHNQYTEFSRAYNAVGEEMKIDFSCVSFPQQTWVFTLLQ